MNVLEEFIEKIKPYLIDYFKEVVEGDDIVKAISSDEPIVQGEVRELGFYLCDDGKIKMIKGDMISTPVYKANCNIVAGLHTHPFAPAFHSGGDVFLVKALNMIFDCVATKRDNKIVINCIENPNPEKIHKCAKEALKEWHKSENMIYMEIAPGVFLPTSDNKSMEKAEKEFKSCYGNVKTFEIPLEK